jgi:hypothetical protein
MQIEFYGGSNGSSSRVRQIQIAGRRSFVGKTA